VRLQAEPPERMLKAVLCGQPSVFFPIGPVLRLQKKLLEVEVLKIPRAQTILRIYELQLVSRSLNKCSVGFGTDADPVKFSRCYERSVRFDGVGTNRSDHTPRPEAWDRSS
jgi:hypothetical protein